MILSCDPRPKPSGLRLYDRKDHEMAQRHKMRMACFPLSSSGLTTSSITVVISMSIT